MAFSVRASRSETTPHEISAKKPPLPLSEVVFEAQPQNPTSNLLLTMNSSKPLEPIEPKPYSLSELEWKRYERARDTAREFAAKNDLSGVPFS